MKVMFNHPFANTFFQPIWKTFFVLLLIFVCTIDSSAMSYFSVYNREHQPVTDAEVTINEVPLKFKSGYGYAIDSACKPPYHLVAKHKDYLTTEYTNLQGLGELYLLREGEDYYYQTPGIKVPVVRHRDLLYVVAASHTKEGKVIDADTAYHHLETLLTANGMKVVCAYKDSFKNAMLPQGSLSASHLNYSYLVGRIDGHEFGEESAELKILRTNPAVVEAGPALLRYDNASNMPMGYGNRIEIMFFQDIEDATVKKRLADAGFPDAAMAYVIGSKRYYIQLPPESGMIINQYVERLQRIPGVVEIEPALVARNNSH